MSPVEVARAYLRSLEARAPIPAIGAFLDDEAVVVVQPNSVDPRGSRRTRAEALAGAERGRALMREERYEILSAVEAGDRAVLEVAWSGVLAVALGKLEAGATMRAHCSMHFEVRSGKIVAQRNYDCFEPW